MSVDTQKETLEFQTEVKQLLHLMIHSLYSNKEIFLRELISNASDAAEKLRFEALGNEALYEDEPNLRLRVSCDPEARTVTVSDNGIGMDDQTRANIFTLFFSSKGHAGTGLGLYISNRIIQQHGGHIHVDSNPDKGSRFEVMLPKELPESAKKSMKKRPEIIQCV